MTTPGPLYQMPPEWSGDDPSDFAPVWYQAGGRPQRDAPRPQRQATSRGYVHTTTPAGVEVVFVPGDVLPEWARTPTP